MHEHLLQFDTTTNQNVEETAKNLASTEGIYLADYSKDIEELEEFFKNSSESFWNQTDMDEFNNYPMKIRLNMMHVHEENDVYFRYDEIVLLSENQEYHEHTSEALENLTHLEIPTNKSLSELKFHDQNLNDILATAETQNHSLILQSEGGKFYLIVKHYNFTPNVHYDEIKFLEVDIKKVVHEPATKRRDSKKHYDRLKEWLTWELK